MLSRYVMSWMLLSLLAWPLSLSAKTDRLFRSHELLKIQLSGPLQQLNRERDKTKLYGPAELSYLAEDGSEVTLATHLEVRGNFRRQKDVCRFTQLRVLFDQESTKDSLFSHQTRLKLVTNCRPGKRTYQAYVLVEYLIYRMFNLLTDNSFKVRLVEMTYRDTRKNKTLHGSLGFFIEHKKRMAKRLDSEQIELNRVSSTQLDIHQAALVAVFQYMIGNTDWSILKGEGQEECCHNAKLLETRDGRTLGIPYDFDFSGMVNAEYAFPTTGIPIKTVRQRYYRGFCKHNDTLAEVFDLMRLRRSDISLMITEEPSLGDVKKKRILRYLQGFYDIIEDPRKVEKRLKKSCR